jgi:hypothetical protein
MPGTLIAEAALSPAEAHMWNVGRIGYRRLAKRLGLLALCVLAATQFVGAYLYLEFPYVDVYRFEHGYERLPFQTRLLTAPLYRWADSNAVLIGYAGRLTRNTYFFPHGIGATEVVEFFVDIACVLFAGWVATAIYRAASRRHLLQPLVFPLFLVLCVLTYILHTVQNFRYIYDMPTLAFFAAGLYLIYFRKPVLWFMALFAVATLNRETTLFLLPLYALSQASRPDPGHGRGAGQLHWQALLAPSTLAVVAPLALYWAVWHHVVFSIFAHNASEYYARVPYNLHFFTHLRYYPQLFSCLGFLLPFLFLGRRFVRDAQLRAWLWFIPVWYAFMMVWGVILETRIFGELLPFVTAYTAVMAEEWLAARMLRLAAPAAMQEMEERSTLRDRIAA